MSVGRNDLAGDSLGFAHIGLRAGDFSFNALEALVHRGFETANARVEIADALCPFSATGRQQSEGPHAPVYQYRASPSPCLAPNQ
jgi:hypothetical protein